ncbi:MAG TPA: hypothetical protein ACFYD4_16305 [Candidatus Wunengus sp. YC61]|uniref:hypothetical protein n=1 Tax=Candidatus Wunengus sp. YC61 TaxID=3367698 RepID=UPI004029E3C4
MKASFYTNVFPVEQIEEAIALLAEMSYDGLELWDQYLASVDIRCLADLIKENGITVVQLCPYFDFVSGPAEGEKTLKIAQNRSSLR